MRKWNVLNDKKDLQSNEEIIEALLANRGFTKTREIENFLNPNLSSVTPKSVGIDQQEIKKAIDRISKAIKKNEKIIIYGDYDVDGICGTAILWEGIYSKYKNVAPYIPHRVDEGYGLSKAGIDNLLKEHPDVKLIITVDNGIVAVDSVAYAHEKNLDVIVTDHHTVGAVLPAAEAIVHTTEICGASVALILISEFLEEPLESLSGAVELAALATVADLVPLKDASRAILSEGLKVLRVSRRAGIVALCQEARILQKKIGVYEIGHMLAPRMNATGRIAHALDSLRLLCTKDHNKAMHLAQMLGKTNRDRQLLTEESSLHAKNIALPEINGSKIVFVAHHEYNPGVIGLVASRLVEEYYLPSFVMSVGEEYSKGSARSISGVNVIELIRSVPKYLVEAGGHPMAAGFTVKTADVENFKAELAKKALEVVTDDLIQRVIKIDLSLPIEKVNYELYNALQLLAPYGMGNPEPVFAAEGVKVEKITKMGNLKNHLKLTCSSLTGPCEMEAVAFGVGEKFDSIQLGDTIRMAYTVDLNEWNGTRKLQLKIRDIKTELEEERT